MKKGTWIRLGIGAGLLVGFAVWTVLVGLVDVRSVGPLDSSVGFAALNGFVHELTGVHMALYTVTDWLGLVPIGVALGFAVLGLVQWIKRKSLLRVDSSLLILGGFYAVVMLVYVLFEVLVVNYRPVLIEGRLEASYPSSTTMLVMCVMPTAILQCNHLIKNKMIRRCVSCAMAAFVAFMVIGRLMSGVHWVTDIIGGAMVSAGLVMMYDAGCRLCPDIQTN